MYCIVFSVFCFFTLFEEKKTFKLINIDKDLYILTRFFLSVFVLCSLSSLTIVKNKQKLNIHHRRRKSTDPKYEKDFVKEQIPKKYVAATGNHSQEDTLDNASKIIPFSSSYG